MRRAHGPNPYPDSTFAGAVWELHRALRMLGYAIVDSARRDWERRPWR